MEWPFTQVQNPWLELGKGHTHLLRDVHSPGQSALSHGHLTKDLIIINEETRSQGINVTAKKRLMLRGHCSSPARAALRTYFPDSGLGRTIPLWELHLRGCVEL